MRILTTVLLLSLTTVFACRVDSTVQPGVWRGVIEIQGQQLPFNFAVTEDSGAYRVFIKNADENLLLDEVSVEDDSIAITLHIFDAQLRASVEGDSMHGYFIKNNVKDYKLPFKAAFNQDFRFAKNSNSNEAQAFEGKYSVIFVNSKNDTTKAVGIFKPRAANIVTGTFLTATGDYRYLEGNVINNELHLSTFDGNNTYLFTAQKNSDSTMTGEFWSGKSSYKKWFATRNEDAELPDASLYTTVKEGAEEFAVTFPDVDGKLVSTTDKEYNDKLLIVQLLGTWCPNCMDETRFLSEWYKENKGRKVKIIGLAYESSADFGYASTRVKKMVEKLDVPYKILIAGSREEAAKTLPMLNKVEAFPTTIFVGKDGKIKKIHTGFSGPGTGEYYEEFISEFNDTVNSLLSDSPSL